MIGAAERAPGKEHRNPGLAYVTPLGLKGRESERNWVWGEAPKKYLFISSPGVETLGYFPKTDASQPRRENHSASTPLKRGVNKKGIADVVEKRGRGRSPMFKKCFLEISAAGAAWGTPK